MRNLNLNSDDLQPSRPLFDTRELYRLIPMQIAELEGPQSFDDFLGELFDFEVEQIKDALVVLVRQKVLVIIADETPLRYDLLRQ